MFFTRKEPTINEQEWERYIHRPDWYLKLLPDYKRLNKRADKNPELKSQLKEQAYSFFEKHLNAGDLHLGKKGPKWDEERKNIDTIVIHHTANPSGLTWQRLSAMHLLRLYASHYIYPPKLERHLKKQPIWSGHFRDGQQVFYSYHWLVRSNGSMERLLNDSEIGWQSGNWNINTRSVAICIDNDLREGNPSKKVLGKIAELIKKRYPDVSHDRIFGHGEINEKTDCPGRNFSTGWKKELLTLLEK
jgi:hypothetical protein